MQEFMFTTLDDIPNKKSFERDLASPLTLRTFGAEYGPRAAHTILSKRLNST